MFEEIHTDNVYKLEADGSRLGPMKATVGAGRICLANADTVIRDGDTLIRPVPGGEESWIVTDACYSAGFGTEIPAFYNPKVRKATALAPAPRSVRNTFNTHFNAPASGIQVGNHNRMSFTTGMEKIIEDSTVSLAQKMEAKSALMRFVENPSVAAILGGLVGGAAGAFVNQ